MHNESNVFSSSAKQLGIIIGDNCTWSTHIEHISIKLSKVNLYTHDDYYNVPEIYVRSVYCAFFRQ